MEFIWLRTKVMLVKRFRFVVRWCIKVLSDDEEIEKFEEANRLVEVVKQVAATTGKIDVRKVKIPKTSVAP